jgi:NAD(P)-dependent dehydrogenase (short-subunit alcohol dehydrogenase family)
MKTWFITGTSRGFGREWTAAALDRGDRVAATARDTSSLDDLVEKYGDAVLPISLDVTDRPAAFAAVQQAHEHLGRLDVVVNNAGYGQFGMIEEVSEAEFRAQIETNLFGALWVTQAALPFLRAQGSGHLIQVSSIGGISAFPNIGAYHASKWALEGFSQALAAEVAGFGIHVTLVEPGGFSTDWGGPSSKRATTLPAYDGVRDMSAKFRAARTQTQGDPHADPGRPARERGRRPAARRRREPPAARLLRGGSLVAGHRGLRAASGHLARVGAAVQARTGWGISALTSADELRPHVRCLARGTFGPVGRGVGITIRVPVATFDAVREIDRREGAEVAVSCPPRSSRTRRTTTDDWSAHRVPHRGPG